MDARSPSVAAVPGATPETPVEPSSGLRNETEHRQRRERGAEAEEAADALRQRLGESSHLEISVDSELERVVVRVVADDSREVVRQIPPDRVLEAAKLIDRLVGLLVDEQM